MRHVRWMLAVCAGILLTASLGLAQGPPTPKPGPEHEQLKQLEGTWDAVINMGGQECKGVMVYKMELAGLWLTSEFKADFFGQKFEGKGLDTYDPGKKKYVGAWADTMAATLLVMEGTHDEATKKTTLTGTGTAPDGVVTKYKSVTEYKDKDTMIFTLSSVDKDGKDQKMMTITYTRKK